MSYDYDTDVSTMEFLGQAHRSLWYYVLSNIFVTLLKVFYAMTEPWKSIT